MEALNYKEISFNILQWIPEGTTYKTATQVCRLWHTICREDLRWMIAKYSNHLWTLINNYPDAKWDWCGILSNPNTTWELIRAHVSENLSDDKWNWHWISQNPNITWKIILENLDKPWDWDWISKNPNITWEIIKSHPDKEWNWRAISWNTFGKK